MVKLNGPSYACSKHGARSSRALVDQGSPSCRFQTGYISTPHGIVGVYTEAALTSLMIVLDGYEHRGWWSATFSERGLITLVKRFAAGRALLTQRGTNGK